MYDCEVCGVKLNGETIREAHLKGAKHQKKIKAAELVSIADQDPTIVKTEANNIFSCSVCDVILNSQMQLKAHLDGSKHQGKAGNSAPKKTESGLQMTSISISAEPPAGVNSTAPAKATTGALKADLYCSHCDVHTNSNLQYQQHMESQKHLSKLKPASNGAKPRKTPDKKPYGRSFINNKYNSFSNGSSYGRGGYNSGYGSNYSGGYNSGFSGNHGYGGGYNSSFSSYSKTSYPNPGLASFIPGGVMMQ